MRAEPTAEEIEAALELPEYEIKLTSERVIAKPRKLKMAWPPTYPEPSAVDRLGALEDPELAEKVRRIDEANGKHDEMVSDLRSLWDDDA